LVVRDAPEIQWDLQLKKLEKWASQVHYSGPRSRSPAEVYSAVYFRIAGP